MGMKKNGILENKRKKEKGLSNQNQAKENLQPRSHNFENLSGHIAIITSEVNNKKMI